MKSRKPLAWEVNFDGLVGLTHNYSGLAYGNKASLDNLSRTSNPKAAVRQGLLKIKFLHDLGLKQGLLPPHERPDINALRRVGFQGTDEQIIKKASRAAPVLFAACCSASSMWAANAATISPSADTADRKVHITPANLVSNFHRSLETKTTQRILKEIFADPEFFKHHAPLPALDAFGDEGAANHSRFCSEFGSPGTELFVYGRPLSPKGKGGPRKFPARQSLEASEAIARLHRLSPRRLVFARQHPEAIDTGVFHNDVIAVGNQNLFLYHEKAFANKLEALSELEKKCRYKPFYFIEVKDDQVSLEEAVRSYLFNSQLVTVKPGEMLMIVPRECEDRPAVWDYLQDLIQGRTPIKALESFDLRQSMQNGGGPACLRLRVVLTEEELAAMNQKFLVNNVLLERLGKWADKHYRDRLKISDLKDPQLLRENRYALDELTQILGIGSIYPFQKV